MTEALPAAAARRVGADEEHASPLGADRRQGEAAPRARPKNHWWHVPLYLDVHGLTTRLLHARRHGFEIRFDFVDAPAGRRDGRRRASRSRSSTGSPSPTSTGSCTRRSAAGVDVDDPREAVRRADDDAVPATTPSTRPTTPRRSRRFWRVLDWSADGASRSSPAGSAARRAPCTSSGTRFDLAVTRFSGRPAPAMPDADPVTQEAYSHEVVSFGFWAGRPERAASRRTTRTPRPSRRACASGRCAPGATWTEHGASSLAVLPYETVRDGRRPARHAARVPRERLPGAAPTRPAGTARRSRRPGTRTADDPAPAADARRRDPRLGRGHDRRHDRQRRAAGDRARPRRRARLAAVGRERLPARARLVDPDRRLARRHLRRAACVRDRRRARSASSRSPARSRRRSRC